MMVLIRKSTASNYLEQQRVVKDNYWEEALKMRNLLEEFNEDHGLHPPTILGVRGHIFTGSISSLGWFMSNQENTKGIGYSTEGCFQYRHPDVFDSIFHIIKGRNIGLNQTSLFEVKVACSNEEQILNRDIYHLGHRFDFFRMLSLTKGASYFTTVGFYVSSMMVVIVVHLFLYGKAYLSLSGLEPAIMKQALMRENNPLKAAMASQYTVQLGLLMALPMIKEIGLKRGFRTALGDIIIMQLQLYLVFLTFLLGTKSHYFGRTILHGGTKYRATGRGFVGRHVKFVENYKMYSISHLTKGLKLMLPLIFIRSMDLQLLTQQPLCFSLHPCGSLLSPDFLRHFFLI
ncbi:hypothetical protein IEQ34_019393 [Dendrobium chrysotoxum]|uniref:Glycosyl transferase 48 domain-containing protein n=1 Tax=Dendrobium chrysotoxum TaxID=161865 RepID=A0AAV7G8G6_DENCH|nr:hypothetical protein IEQ34_019393 [Dendrobium chrysotoxum]